MSCGGSQLADSYKKKHKLCMGLSNDIIHVQFEF